LIGRLDTFRRWHALPIAILLILDLCEAVELSDGLVHRNACIHYTGRVPKSPKSLMRMLSAEGNPQARNLFEMLAYLQKLEGTVLEVRAAAAA
jgi:hypothetical protein